MIHELSPQRFDNTFSARVPSASDRVMLFGNGTMLVKPLEGQHCFDFPVFEEFSQVFPSGYAFFHAFAIDDVRYYLAFPETTPVVPGDTNGGKGADDNNAPSLGGMQYQPIEEFRKTSCKAAGHAAQTGWHLHRWYTRNRWCGMCGNPMKHAATERALQCPTCGNRVYPTIAPAVIVAVVDGDRLLMTRYSHRAYRARALVAGFCEIGETAEETVSREVFEETGLCVKNIRYYKSQPWGYAGDLLLGYVCELDGSPKIMLDEKELATAEWVPRDEIFEENDDVSLTREMITRFKEGLL